MVTRLDIGSLSDHWAVAAITESERERADEISNRYLLESTLQLNPPTLDEEQANLLRRVATAYELAAIEGLDALLHPQESNESGRLRAQCQAAAYIAYHLLRSVPIPNEVTERIFHVLHLASLAYCGDRWAELRRWLKEKAEDLSPPSIVDETWDRRILFRLYDCWLRLLRKDGWDDLHAISEIVAGLRADQASFEQQQLDSETGLGAQAVALRLLALYNLARSTERLGEYMLQGTPSAISTELDSHFELSQKAVAATADPVFEILLRWLHLAARRMAAGSVWATAQSIAPEASRLVESLTKNRGMFELLPPQRAAIQEQGLLDVASRAVVIDLPTSGGKTVLAEFRILQALNQFDAERGWVAYVAPTRALVAQVTRRLREDFEPLGIIVEQLSSAIEVDTLEDQILRSDQPQFHVLVSTPEKLHFVVRNQGAQSRPLALLVMDEAHNIEDAERGLRIELLLATIKRDLPTANFLLLMPHVPNANDLARWLSPQAGKTISLGTSVWQPNERVVGVFSIERDHQVRAGWKLQFETLTTPRDTVTVPGSFVFGTTRPLNIPFSAAKNSLTKQTGAMARVASTRGTSIAVAQTIPNVWSMARNVADSLQPQEPIPDPIQLVQRFLATEVSPQFELISMLERGVGVHHAGLSDEARELMEWLAEDGILRVLCATTTIAQGINFPVASVFLASRYFPYGHEMTPRTFWNLAGRAGRVDQDNMGIVGLASGADLAGVKQYVSTATGNLVSRLIGMLDELQQRGELQNLALLIQEDQWADFRSYVAHLWRQKGTLDAVLAETEQLLRNTYGYSVLQASGEVAAREKARALLDATRQYAALLAQHPENASLADATGFAPEGVRSALLGLTNMERSLQETDWEPASLFGGGAGSALAQLVGVMFRIPELRRDLEKMGTHGRDHQVVAAIAQAWVMGSSLEDIAKRFFLQEGQSTENLTNAITQACRGIYGVLANAGTWGLSALTKLPTAGIDFDSLSDEMRRKINLIPAMLYHGVRTESGVLMRMNSVPRSVAETLGAKLESEARDVETSPRLARDFLRSLTEGDWDQAAPEGAAMTGADYRTVWGRLAGERV